MSTEAYSRSTAREARVWTPFVYSFPFDTTQTADRTTIFGLYSSAYLNRNKYLLEIETEDLANLLADYNMKMADLTNQETIIVNDIVSRRYLAGIDKLIHDKKMETKESRIEADEALWDEKIAALATDEAALETMAVKITSETDKTAARITEIESYIEMESIHLDMADIEIAEKEIQSAKVDIQKLDAANAALKIQIDTVRTAQELIDIDAKIARVKVEIAETDRAMKKIDLLENELTIEQARTDVAEAELPAAAARVTLAQAKNTEAQDEIDYISTLETQAATNHQNKIDLMNTKQTGRVSSITMNRQEKDLQYAHKIDLADLEIAFMQADADLQPQLDASKVSILTYKAANEWSKAYAAVQVAQTLAAANIASTLTHVIQKST
jgi:hypothetical protein